MDRSSPGPLDRLRLIKGLFVLLLSVMMLSGCTAADPAHTSAVIDGTVSVNLTAADDAAQVVIKGRVSTDNYTVPMLDSATGTIVNTTLEHYMIHIGKTFTVLEVTDLGNMGIRDILVVTPDSTEWAHLVWEIEHELETSIQFYIDTVYTDNGTAVASFNRHGNSNIVATTLVYHTPTISNDGLLLATIQQGDGKKAGGSDREANEFILEQGTDYLIRISNLTVDNNLIFLKMNWYEHTNE